MKQYIKHGVANGATTTTTTTMESVNSLSCGEGWGEVRQDLRSCQSRENKHYVYVF
jgi:hypothetical protein